MSDCHECGGSGMGDVIAVHGCDGTETACARICPVPQPTPCDRCQGTGNEPTERI